MTILACIPAFNEEKVIKKVVKETLKFVDKVVVCDDGSSDITSQKAKESGAEVIKHSENKGKGAALRSLFDYASKSNFDVIVTIDGDGQFIPSEIKKITAPIIEKKSDIVIGYRFDSDEQMPKYRKFGNKVLDKMTNLAVDLPFRDTQSGFRAYSIEAIRKIKFSTNGFGADSEILMDVAQKGFDISEIKVSVIYNTGNKTSTKGPIVQSGEVIATIIESIAINHPLKYLGIPGIVLTIIGIVFSVMVMILFNETRYFSIPQTIIAVGTIVIGLLLVLTSTLLFSINRILKKNEK